MALLGGTGVALGREVLPLTDARGGAAPRACRRGGHAALKGAGGGLRCSCGRLPGMAVSMRPPLPMRNSLFLCTTLRHCPPPTAARRRRILARRLARRLLAAAPRRRRLPRRLPAAAALSPGRRRLDDWDCSATNVCRWLLQSNRSSKSPLSRVQKKKKHQKNIRNTPLPYSSPSAHTHHATAPTRSHPEVHPSHPPPLTPHLPNGTAFAQALPPALPPPTPPSCADDRNAPSSSIRFSLSRST